MKSIPASAAENEQAADSEPLFGLGPPLLACAAQLLERVLEVAERFQGLATLEQFYELRFQVDHVDRLKKNGRIHYRMIWKNHIKPTLGAIQMREVAPQMLQKLVSAKIEAGLSPQTITHIRNCVG